MTFSLDADTAGNKAATIIRSEALKIIQDSNPGIAISFSLPVSPTGLSADSLDLLKSAEEHGIIVERVNINAYNYASSVAPNAGVASGTYCIQAATFTYSQIQTLGLGSKIGVVVMIGQADVASEFFQHADAKQVVNWAKSNSWVTNLSFYSANRDGTGLSGITQEDGDFTEIFKGFQ